jgi:hypothetical protein
MKYQVSAGQPIIVRRRNLIAILVGAPVIGMITGVEARGQPKKYLIGTLNTGAPFLM